MTEKDIIIFFTGSEWGAKRFGLNTRIKNFSFKRRSTAVNHAKIKLLVSPGKIYTLNKDCTIYRIYRL